MAKSLKILWWKFRVKISIKTLEEIDVALLKKNQQRRQQFWRDFISSPRFRAELFKKYPEIIFAREGEK